jgi:hypothetical protein
MMTSEQTHSSTAAASVTTLPSKKTRASKDVSIGIPKGTPDVIATAIRESGLSYETYVRAITANALSDLASWTQSDLERLIATATKLGLSPLNREIFMLSNAPDLPPLIAVGVDGWAKVMNAHPQFAGMSFTESTQQSSGVPEWMECEIHRHDRVVALKVREYFEEARSDHMAWITHPRRMLRHKCMVQCARLAFGLSGIYDTDEAMRIRQQSQQRRNQNQASVLPDRGVTALRKHLQEENSTTAKTG